MATATTAAVVWTFNRLVALLETNRVALEKAILTINARQTADEQAAHRTAHLNGRGWNAMDAQTGGSLADWITTGRETYHRAEGESLRISRDEYAGRATPRTWKALKAAKQAAREGGRKPSLSQRDLALLIVVKYWAQLLEEIESKGGKVDYSREGADDDAPAATTTPTTGEPTEEGSNAATFAAFAGEADASEEGIDEPGF